MSDMQSVISWYFALTIRVVNGSNILLILHGVVMVDLRRSNFRSDPSLDSLAPRASDWWLHQCLPVHGLGAGFLEPITSPDGASNVRGQLGSLKQGPKPYGVSEILQSPSEQ
jgi:hypothetical protein